MSSSLYLENSGIEIEGLKIWGSPITPTFHSWAWNRDRGEEINTYWEAIPDNTNILITHGPAYGILDFSLFDSNVGCKDLKNRIDKLSKLKLFVVGHIHEAAGHINYNGIHCINASILNIKYQPINPVIQVNL